MARFASGPIVLKTTDLNSGNAINIGAVTSSTIRTNSETISDDSGDIYDEAISLLSQVIDAQQTFKCLNTILTYVGLSGYCILGDGSHPGWTIYGRILGDCKSPPLTTDNPAWTFKLGLAYLMNISARRGQDATIGVMIKPISDGTNAPMAWTYASNTLPATSGLLKDLFTIGACKVAGLVLNDFDGLDLQFGVKTSAETPMMGSVWSDSIAVRKVQPIATFTGFDPRILDNSIGVPLLGKQATHANTLIQFKKRLNYSAFVADAIAQHVSLTMNGQTLVTDVFTGTGNSEATNAIIIKGIHDGTNVPIIVNPATTYNPSP